ncbi:MAG: hypothetical protein DRQ55_06645 [Planctomycetota bacterium]|nr:MAG: hypothetical protein DRQ55_06645 [Planctomycetota bacterium]
MDSAAEQTSLTERLRRSARQAPHAPALLWRGTCISRSGLWNAVRVWSARLEAHDVAPGARVLLDLARGPHWVAAHFALLRLGAVTLPVNPGSTATELSWIAADAEPMLSLCTPEREAVHASAGLETRLVHGADWPLGDSHGEGEGHAGLDERAERRARNAADLALLLYTSGTTGRPKGVMLTHGNLQASVSCLSQAWELSADDRLLHTLPLFHVHGLVVALHATLAAGGAVELLPRFEVDAVWSGLTSGRVTLFMGVPTMYHRLLSDAPATGARLDRLRLCTCGSAPLPASRLAAWEQFTGQRILERYGLTEAGMVCGNPLHGERRAGGVGLDLPGVRTRLATPGEASRDAGTASDASDAVSPRPQPAEGEVQVRGPQVFSGYLNQPDATAAAFSADGWLRTGDLGRRDEAGHLIISGRIKELIISGGFNVHPGEVELALCGHPAVREAAVFGLPDDDWGERVVAAVVLAPDAILDMQALLGHCAERLAPYKRPRALASLESLPRNAMGKLQRGRLAVLCGWER